MNNLIWTGLALIILANILPFVVQIGIITYITYILRVVGIVMILLGIDQLVRK